MGKLRRRIEGDGVYYVSEFRSFTVELVAWLWCCLATAWVVSVIMVFLV
jgi:hypothetical protein